jgi:hypothetical protein
MGCPKNWVPGTFEKLEMPLCSEFSGDPGNAIKKFFLRRSELRTWTSTHEVPCSSPRIPALSFSSDFPSSSSGLVMGSHWAGSVLRNEKKKTKILCVKERNFYIENNKSRDMSQRDQGSLMVHRGFGQHTKSY